MLGAARNLGVVFKERSKGSHTQIGPLSLNVQGQSRQTICGTKGQSHGKISVSVGTLCQENVQNPEITPICHQQHFYIIDTYSTRPAHICPPPTDGFFLLSFLFLVWELSEPNLFSPSGELLCDRSKIERGRKIVNVVLPAGVTSEQQWVVLRTS